MRWFSSKFLRQTRRISKLINYIGVFISGLIFAQLARMFSAGGVDVLTSGLGLILLLGLLILIFFVAVTYILDIWWLDPATRDADIIIAAMRYLYHIMFNSESGHRITFLAQRNSRSSYIRPRYRYAYGSGTRLESKARFRRGSALAGMAWDNPGGNTIMVRELPDFGNDETTFLRFMQDDLKIPEAEAKRLSREIRNSRWIYCYGIVEPSAGEFIGVISLDSRNPDALNKVDNELVQRVSALIASVVKKSSQ